MNEIGLESIFKLSILINMIDNMSRPAGAVQDAIDQTSTSVDKLNKQFGDLAKQGAGIAAVGGAILMGVLAPVQSTFETQRALGELRSVGIKDITAIEAAALEFSNTWSGTVKPDFIAAAYDIKSGIASLSDEGVAGYATIAALTAKATKSSVAEMTSLFATGYGIYKGYYKDLTDLEFAEMFGAGIAESVNKFKSTGSGMAQAISGLGAAASNAQIPMEEQFAILGMMQQTMSGGEAGTKYRAFLKSAAQAGDELGLSFLDANNQLLSMPEILGVLHGRFGDTLDAVEKLDLQKAFGTEEAVALLDLLYPKVGELEANVMGLSDTLGNGTKTATDMAQAMNNDPGSQWEILTQQGHNLQEMLGDSLAPSMDSVMGSASSMILKMQEWVQAHPNLTKAIMILFTILGVLLVAAGSLIAFIGLGGMMLGQFSLAWGVLRGAVLGFLPVMGSAITSTIAFTAALLANPITWVVIGIAALIYALYLLWKNFDWVKEKVDQLPEGFVNLLAVVFPFLGIPLLVIRNWDTIGPYFRNLFSNVKTDFNSFMTALPNMITEKMAQFRESGAAIMRTFADGIRSTFKAPADAIRSGLQMIRQMLPFSDAKEGPLSQLTLNGRKIFETIAAGMPQGVPSLMYQTQLGFEGITQTGGKAMRRTNLLGDPGYKRVNLREIATERQTVTERTMQAKGGGDIFNEFNFNIARIEEMMALLKAYKDLNDFVEATGGGTA